MSPELSSQATEDLATRCGLTKREWDHLTKTLGRTPSIEELQMIGVMWSEHCSYKSSKPFLKRLMTKGERVLQGPGENAGLVSLDRKRAIAFKVESHNHPSFVEPFQGAATGVGGILRDIFTMGARPIATGNYLRFGDLTTSKHRYLLEGVVGGIAHYGNCIGIPNIAGQVNSHSCYQGNILVNVFALGIVDQDKIFKSSTASAGQSIMIWGAKTGRDGIHGASLLASADFQSNTESTEQKIRVQVGDPFKEKCLLEATLAAMTELREDLTAIQDMGAAGLTCSTLEMSDKSNVGMRVDLTLVPVREDKMEAWELLLSESQERMLAIVKKGSESKFQEILSKWGCESAVIGETTEEKFVHMTYQGKDVVYLPVGVLMDPPAPDLPKPEWSEGSFQTSGVSFPADVKREWEVLLQMLSHPNVSSKQEVYKRYDSTVGAATVFGPGHEAALLWVGGDQKPHQGVAFKGTADEELYQVDAKYAASAAVARCVRSLACVGARAIGLTDGVNVGNPHNPKVLGALARTVDGLNEAIQIFETPCIGGNVSMYNKTVVENKATDIYPTTFVILAGVMDDVRQATPSIFQKAGNEVWLIEAPGNTQQAPVGSLYSRLFWPAEFSNLLPHLDLKSEKRLQEALLQAHQQGWLASCRDVSLGGMSVSLAKACFSEKSLGFEGDWSKTQARRDHMLFNETHGRVIVEIEPSKRSQLLRLGIEWNLEMKRLGTVLSEPIFRLRPLLSGSIEDLYRAWTSVFR